MVDANAPVAGSLAGLLWEPVVFVVLRQQLLQALAEGPQLLFAPEALDAEEAGDEFHSSTDFSYHGGCRGTEGMPGVAESSAV